MLTPVTRRLWPVKRRTPAMINLSSTGTNKFTEDIVSLMMSDRHRLHTDIQSTASMSSTSESHDRLAAFYTVYMIAFCTRLCS